LRQAREPPRSRVRREPESAGASRRGTMGGPGPSTLVVGTSPHRRERKEAGKLTAMVAHPPLEERSLEESTGLLLPELYETPVAEVEHVERETESYVAWVVVLGFVAYALALYWADRCNRRGGDPVIRFSVLRGFIVKCYK
jgi:hypothetical protein